MKSHYENEKGNGRGKRQQKINITPGRKDNKSFSEAPNVIELRKSIFHIVREDYGKLLEMHGEDKAMEVLEGMATREYVAKFHPQTREVKKAVRACVEQLITTVSKGIIDERSKQVNVKAKDVGTLKSDLAYLKRIEAVARRTPFHDKVSELIQTYDSEISTRTAEMQEEVSYYETVEQFTYGFKFLINEPMVMQSQYGAKAIKKFNSFEQYNRFNNLRNLIQANVNKETDEQGAINKILTEIEEKRRILRPADRKILINRSKVIENEKRKEKEER